MTGLRYLLALLLFALCAVPPAAAAASVPGAGVRERLANTAVLRGRFEQEKRLQGFRNPLLSTGDFLLARDRGVVWNTRTPFASTIVLTRQRLLARQADGSERNLFEKGNSPAISTANSLLMALLGGDIDALAREFDLSETLLPDGGWSLVLVPKPGALRKVFRRIVLAGDRNVRTVVLEEPGGDRTEIRFLELRDKPASLDAAELKQFE